VPIAYGLSFPERITSGASQLDFTALSSLSFSAPDHRIYPGLNLAWQSLHAVAGTTAVLNAANEVAVAAFLDNAIRFDQIHALNEAALESVVVTSEDSASVDALIALDLRTRASAQQHVKRLQK
jgi:1-deoxy-D-xylulose-5-phosphate reductoisomerase